MMLKKIGRGANSYLMAALVIFVLFGLWLYESGRVFEPISDKAFMAFFAAFFLAAAVLTVIYKREQTVINRVCGLLLPIVTPVFAIHNALTFEDKYRFLNLDWFIFTLFLEVPALVIFFSLISSRAAKIAFVTVVGLSSVLLIIILPSLLFVMVMLSFSSVKAEESVASVDGRYEAWVEIHDEGALGGDVSVYVREAGKDRCVLIGNVKGKKHELAMFYWGTEAELIWESDTRLNVNGEIYDAEGVCE